MSKTDDHVLHSARTPAEAEREHQRRQLRVESFSIKPLSHEDADRFSATWRSVQARFVDDPRSAVVEADRRIGEVMRSRGYPEDLRVALRKYRSFFDRLLSL